MSAPWELGVWTRDAACREADPDIFEIPNRRGSGRNQAMHLQRAARYCAACPVIEQCLAAGKQLASAYEITEDGKRKHVRRDLHGVWGGVLFGEKGKRKEIASHVDDLTFWQEYARDRDSARHAAARRLLTRESA